jgi:GDPmannose 4,6-dehydratase
MWMSLQAEQGGDYIFATGRLHSVQDVVEHAFRTVELDWQKFVKQDPRFLRPAEPQRLVGDTSKARQVLGWEPNTDFSDLIQEMTLSEVGALSRSRTSKASDGH